MKIRKALVGSVMLVGFVAPLAACGDDDPKPVPVASNPTESSTASDPTADPNVAPTKLDLQAMLDKALDPNIPAAEKTDLVQGAQNDAALFDTLVQLRAENPTIAWTISDVITLQGPGQAKADATITLDTTDTPVTVDFIFEDGKWKVSQSYACQMIAQAGTIEGAPSITAQGCA